MEHFRIRGPITLLTRQPPELNYNKAPFMSRLQFVSLGEMDKDILGVYQRPSLNHLNRIS